MMNEKTTSHEPTDNIALFWRSDGHDGHKAETPVGDYHTYPQAGGWIIRFNGEIAVKVPPDEVMLYYNPVGMMKQACVGHMVSKFHAGTRRIDWEVRGSH